MQLIVLGMHRSGTSAATRLLNLAGAYFGPEGVTTGANDENPKGFWERRDIRALNDALLHSIGCDWNRVSELKLDAFAPEVSAQFEKRASRLVMGMDAHRPWVAKEPRLCLLLPLWRKVLEAPICIHVLRNPLEVAASLRQRNGIPVDAGLALWEVYVRSAVNASKDMPTAFLSHQDLMAKPQETLRNLLDGLHGLGVSGLRMPSRVEIDSFIDPRLYRQRHDSPDLAPYANAPQLELFHGLIRSAGRCDLDGGISPDDRMALVRYEGSLPAFRGTGSLSAPEPPIRRLERRIAELEARVDALMKSREQAD